MLFRSGGIGCTKWIVLHSPQASTPGAVSYHGSSGLKPLPVPEKNGSVFPTQLPDHRVSAQKLTRMDGEVGDTESHAAPPGAMQQAQKPKEACAWILKSQQTLPLSSKTPALEPRDRRPKIPNTRYEPRPPCPESLPWLTMGGAGPCT